ncbi:MAG: glycoside hydrolase family 43 protein [Lachnospiraceae bacterium]|nr:glycoside hydrolase family 43 protein [Lachnospiraceae bacterium]
MNYTNPILKGFNPDPSIVRVGKDYYLVTSSFEYFPGIPIYHSTDLVNWKQIGNCIENPNDLPFDKAKASGGIWAPTIRYNDGRFYVTATFDGYGNFIISSEDPQMGWTKPVKAQIGGIDPSIFFEKGRAYYTTNARGADGKEAITLVRIDVVTGELLGEVRQIWNGTGGGFLEAPHIYRVGRWYYLIAAEGGTNFGHMVTVARSREIWGPYEAYEDNPILSNRNDTTKRIACAGHGDLVEDANGNWWMVHLGTRPTNNWLSHIGRETFLMPVIWADEWPMVGHNSKAQLSYEGPLWEEQRTIDKWKADFTHFEHEWLRLRRPVKENYILRDGRLVLKPTSTKLSSETGSPTFMAMRHFDMECKVMTKVRFDTFKDNDEAGMVLYLSDKFYYSFCKKRKDGKDYIMVQKHADDFKQLVCKREIGAGAVKLVIEASKDEYRFYYSVGEEELRYAGSAATRFLSCELAGKCFTGTLMGLYAQCDEQTKAEAMFYGFIMERRQI